MKDIQGKARHTPIPELINPATSSLAKTAQDKADLLNSFFVHQTLLVGAESTLPDVASLPENNESFMNKLLI